MKNEEYTIKKLNRNEFADALQKGLGRAYLHAIRYGIDEVADLVLKACLHDQAYDPQSESSKAKWLFEMFKNAQHLPKFSEAILSCLKNKRETWDLLQIFEIAFELAKYGNSRARDAVRERAIKKASRASIDEWLGAEQWIDLAGLDGAIELARIYGLRLLRNPEDFVPENEIFPNDTIKRDFQLRLTEDSKKEPALEAYYNYLKKRGDLKASFPNYKVDKEAAFSRQRERVRKKNSLSSIVDDAKNKIDEHGIRYRQFGKFATKEELETIYSQLLNETDDSIRLRLLWVFSRAPLPRLNDIFFYWANGDYSQLREASISALSQLIDTRVHALARNKIQNSKLAGADSGSIELFVNNYEHDDAKLITNALYRTSPNKEDAHSLAWDIIDLSKKYQDTGLVDALKWAYEKTPCSACRYRIVEQLDLLGQFTGEVFYECQFDGNGDIVELARQKVVS